MAWITRSSHVTLSSERSYGGGEAGSKTPGARLLALKVKLPLIVYCEAWPLLTIGVHSVAASWENVLQQSLSRLLESGT